MIETQSQRSASPTSLALNNSGGETNMKRARFTVNQSGTRVTLHTPNGVTRTFCIPYTLSSGEGYVREGDNMGPQVCDGLTHRGNTLRATPESLLPIIRAEWRRWKRSEEYEFSGEI